MEGWSTISKYAVSISAKHEKQAHGKNQGILIQSILRSRIVGGIFLFCIIYRLLELEKHCKITKTRKNCGTKDKSCYSVLQA